MPERTEAPEREREVEVLSEGALTKIDRAEIDMQIATAHKYGRSISKFQTNALDMVTLSPETAGECFYRLKRKDKDGKTVIIEGGSIRLAEIVACTWGNMRAGQRVADIDDTFVYGEGFCHDLESNLAVRVEVSRRITGSTGRRYGDDMIGVTANAACSIAYRNAVLKVVPKAMWIPLLKAAQKLFRGDEKSLGERRKLMLEEFKKLKVTEKMICDYLDVPGVADIGLDELMDLRGAYTAIMDGSATVDETFAAKEAATDQEQPRRKSDAPAGAKAPAPDPAAPGMATPEDVELVHRTSITCAIEIARLKRYIKKTRNVDAVKDLKHDDIAVLVKEIEEGKPLSD